MALRRPPRPDRSARLSALESAVTRPPLHDEVTLGDLTADLDIEARAIVVRWLSALSAPQGSADRSQVCCKVHALRRVWTWLRAPTPVAAFDLARIEQNCLCPKTPSLSRGR